MQLSDMPREKYPANSPNFFFIKKKSNMELTSNAGQDQT
jgi:hypothetical protein